MIKALVTGATGFIGKILVNYLLERQVSVRVLVRQTMQDIFPATVEQRVGDLINSGSLMGIGEDIDIVFHLGGFAHAWKDDANVAEQHKQINLGGTQNILDECVRARVKKFIFFSTIKAVGDSEQCIDEQWDALPITPYGKAKRIAEECVLSVGKQHNMHVCILRLALVYGPKLKGNLFQMLRAIDRGYFLAIPPIKNHRSLVSVYDVCEAGWLAAHREEANGKIYFVTDKESYSTYYLYTQMRAALGRSNPRWHIPLHVFKLLARVGDIGERVMHHRLPFNSQAFAKLFSSSYCSSAHIQNELGFSPRYSLTKLLPEIIQIYRAEQS